MRRLSKSEKSLFLTACLTLAAFHAFWNTSLTKQGFIRRFSHNYDRHVISIASDHPFFKDLALSAEKRTALEVEYDGSYQKIPYPNGDVDVGKGVCTDVVVRSYRAFGVDLQELIHMDMERSFLRYPKMWRKLRPDTNIDHRRVPNQMVFFQRNGDVLPITIKPADYKLGDIVAWNFGNGLMHVGIVSTRFSNETMVPLIVHNIGRGPEVSDILFRYPIIGHFKYMPSTK